MTKFIFFRGASAPRNYLIRTNLFTSYHGVTDIRFDQPLLRTNVYDKFVLYKEFILHQIKNPKYQLLENESVSDAKILPANEPTLKGSIPRLL